MCFMQYCFMECIVVHYIYLLSTTSDVIILKGCQALVSMVISVDDINSPLQIHLQLFYHVELNIYYSIF